MNDTSTQTGAQTDTRRRALFLFLSFFLSGLVAAWLSQYVALDELIKRFSARAASPAIGYWLYSEKEANRQVRNQITVLTLDDRDLEIYNTSYPVNYEFHAKRLRAIAAYRPKAILVDFWFHDNRPDSSIRDFAEELCLIRSQGVRLYAASLSFAGAGKGLRPELAQLASRRVWIPSEKRYDTCLREVSASKQVDNLDQLTWEYELASPGKQMTTATLPTAAAAIYEDLHPNAPLPPSADPLALLWGTAPDPVNELWMRDRESGKPACRELTHASQLIPIPTLLREVLLPAGWQPLKLPLCPYHRTLPLRALRQMNRPDHPWGSLEDMLSGKIIFYGADLQSVSDLANSPVHKQIPGIHTHAMALDNLLVFGQNYPRAVDFSLARPASRGTIFPILAVFLISLAATGASVIKWRNLAAKSEQEPSDTAKPPRSQRLTHVLRTLATHPEKIRKHLTDRVASAARWHQRIPFMAIRGTIRLLEWAAKAIAMAISLLILLLLVGWVGFSIAHVGVLSWVEYGLLPLAIKVVDKSERIRQWLEEMWPPKTPEAK